MLRSMLSLVGETPLVEFKSQEIHGATILVKLESYNPTGSIKDRACVNCLEKAQQSGQLSKGKILLDASSGNMACALAYFGKLLGIGVEVVCNSKLTKDKKDFIHYFGAKLLLEGDLTIEGNRVCRKMAEEMPDRYFFMDQLHNPANPQSYENTLAKEIHSDIPDVNAVVGSMGSGGSMCGVARYFNTKNKSTKVFTTQAVQGTKIPGTIALADGDYITPFITELMNNPVHAGSFSISQSQAEQRTRQLADQGIFAGFQAGGVLETTISAIKKYDIKGNVVMVIGDSGWKNMDKLSHSIK